MSFNNSKEKADKLISWLREYALLSIDSQLADEQRLYPPHVLLDLGNQGFFGMHISEKYGGLELSTFDMLRVIEQVAAIDLTLSIILIESIQGAHTVEKYASESMKNDYLPSMASGRVFTSGAMTESEAGSNPRGMKSVATPDSDNAWLINGSKRWVGMGASAGVIALYVQQFDENETWQGMSGFLVPRNAVGLTIGQDTPTLGMRGFAKNNITMKNVKVNAENLLGQVGEGMEIAQDNMMYIRLCLAAATIGAMKRCVQIMYRYAQRRTIATGALLENPVTLVQFAQITDMIEAIDRYVYLVAQHLDDSPDSLPEEALVISKITGSECLGFVVDRALQLLGARGYEEACEVAKLFRDARAFRIFEGPTEALNMYLGARALGRSATLESFVCKTLEQSQLFNETMAHINQVKKNVFSSTSTLFLKPFTNSYLTQSLAGEILNAGLFLACLKHSQKMGDTQTLKHALRWASKRYDKVVEEALLLSSEGMPNVTSEDITQIVNHYTGTVGHIDQTRSGKNSSIDRLLRSSLVEELDDLSPHQHHQVVRTKRGYEGTVSKDFQATHGCDNSQKVMRGGIEKTTQYELMNVCQLFEQKASQHPKEIALVFQNQRLTYAELDEKANKVAHYLQERLQGLATKVVALYFERSVEQIIAMLGILKSGCAYLPMDFNYPEKQLGFMLDDSDASLILSSKILADDFPFDAVKTVFIEEALETVLPEKPTPHVSNIDLDNTGYIIYTSGSTGQPKGVMLPHRALTNLIQWHLDNIGGKRNVLQFTTINFDMSFIEIFGALCSGGTLVLISEQDRLNLARFAEIVEVFNVDQLVLSVPYLKALADSQLNKQGLKQLKEIIIAGEQLVVTPALESLFEQLPACQLHNYYGPSETHVVTAYAFPKRVTDWPDYPPIGKVIPNSSVYVLDENMQVVSGDTVGELYLGGACLASGYCNRRELSEERFIPNPFSEKKGDKLYKTGDLGKYLPDGNLVYLGRKDEQVKIRGYRIEPQEIEWHLIKYPSVKEAVVVAKKNNHSDRHLEAFLVMDGVVQDNFVAEIDAFLRTQMPPHMIPSVFNLIKTVPWTNSGKVDRIALEKIEGEVVYAMNDIVLPVTETEKVMIDIVESVFKMRVGTNHSFFAIGGNSLLAIHVLSELKERFLIEIPAYSILSDPSIAHTAARIDELLKTKNGTIH